MANSHTRGLDLGVHPVRVAFAGGAQCAIALCAICEIYTHCACDEGHTRGGIGGGCGDGVDGGDGEILPALSLGGRDRQPLRDLESESDGKWHLYRDGPRKNCKLRCVYRVLDLFVAEGADNS